MTSPPDGPSPATLTALDWIGVVVSLLTIAALLAFVAVGQAYAAMYRDLGALATLPLLTRLASSGFGPPVLAAPSGLALALAARLKSIGQRRAAIALAFAWALVALAVCVVGVYLPLYQVARAIGAD